MIWGCCRFFFPHHRIRVIRDLTMDKSVNRRVYCNRHEQLPIPGHLRLLTWKYAICTVIINLNVTRVDTKIGLACSMLYYIYPYGTWPWTSPLTGGCIAIGMNSCLFRGTWVHSWFIWSSRCSCVFVNFCVLSVFSYMKVCHLYCNN
jgi:hypothetical protein